MPANLRINVDAHSTNSPWYPLLAGNLKEATRRSAAKLQSSNFGIRLIVSLVPGLDLWVRLKRYDPRWPGAILPYRFRPKTEIVTEAALAV